MFEIICLGRLDFLVSVLNGLAMLTSSSGPAGYGGMVALGLLIGVILALARGIVTQRLELQWVLLGWLMFSVLFVPKVTVTVEDIYTGATTTVANVPLGPAAIGSITSTVGVTLADAFGTVFAYPSLTNSGYMDSLELINAMRDMDYGGANDGDAARVVPGVDLQRTLRNYMMDCVFYDMEMGLPSSLDWQRLRESPDVLTAMRVNSNTWFTTQYLQANNLSGQTVTCADGYTQLAAFVNGPFATAWNQHIGAVLKITDTTTQVQRALDTFFGLGKDAQVYMFNTLLKRELELSELGYHVQGHDDAGVIMRVQAMEQRRTQWAAEQSMWAEMARPIIAFIEGFFYAVSPFAAFMFTLGAAGITLFGRYLLLAVWIQLWMPVLAVANLYITIAAASGLQQLGAGGTDPMSIAGLDSVWTQTASWLAIGGSMVAATPLLSLILITGSYFALTRLTDRLSGADHVNEKIQSPDIMQPAAFAAIGAQGMQSARYAADPSYGLHAHGAEQIAPTISLASSLSRAQQSRTASAVEASNRVMKETFSGVDLSRKQNVEGFIQNYIGESSRSNSSQTDHVLESLSRSVVNNEERYKEMSTAERATVGAAIALGMAGGKVDGLLQSISGTNEGEVRAWSERIDQIARHEKGRSVDLARAMVQDKQEGTRSQILRSMGVQDGERSNEAVGAAASAVRSYDEVAGLNEMAELRQSISSLSYGQIAQTTGSADELTRIVSSYNDPQRGLTMQNVQEIAGIYRALGWSTTQEHATGAAAAVVLAQGSVESALDLAKYSARHFGSRVPGLRDSQENQSIQGITNQLQSFPSVQEGVRQHISGSGLNDSQLRSSMDARLGEFGTAGSEELRERGEAAVTAFFQARQAENKVEMDRAMAEIENIATIEEAKAVETTWQDTRSLMRYMNEENLWDRSKGIVAENVGRSIGAAAAGVHSKYEEVVDEGGSRAWASAVSLAAGAKGLVEGWANVRDDKFYEAMDQAKSHGLPESAARYYAFERALPFSSAGDRTEYMVTENEEYNRLRQGAEADLGYLGAEILKRAAYSNETPRERYLGDAAALYKRDHLLKTAQ